MLDSSSWTIPESESGGCQLGIHTDIRGHLFRQLKVNQQDKTSVSSRTTYMYESSLAPNAIPSNDEDNGIFVGFSDRISVELNCYGIWTFPVITSLV